MTKRTLQQIEQTLWKKLSEAAGDDINDPMNIGGHGRPMQIDIGPGGTGKAKPRVSVGKAKELGIVKSGPKVWRRGEQSYDTPYPGSASSSVSVATPKGPSTSSYTGSASDVKATTPFKEKLGSRPLRPEEIDAYPDIKHVQPPELTTKWKNPRKIDEENAKIPANWNIPSKVIPNNPEVWANLQYLAPSFRNNLSKALEKYPGVLRVESAYRDQQRQTELYNSYIKKLNSWIARKNDAERQGKPFRERQPDPAGKTLGAHAGYAIDVNPTDLAKFNKWLRDEKKAGRDYGLEMIPGDSVHLQLAGAGQAKTLDAIKSQDAKSGHIVPTKMIRRDEISAIDRAKYQTMKIAHATEHGVQDIVTGITTGVTSAADAASKAASDAASKAKAAKDTAAAREMGKGYVQAAQQGTELEKSRAAEKAAAEKASKEKGAKDVEAQRKQEADKKVSDWANKVKNGQAALIDVPAEFRAGVVKQLEKPTDAKSAKQDTAPAAAEKSTAQPSAAPPSGQQVTPSAADKPITQQEIDKFKSTRPGELLFDPATGLPTTEKALKAKAEKEKAAQAEIEQQARAAAERERQAKVVTPAEKPTQPIGNWKDIYNLNKGVIGADPNKIKPGQKLTMPDNSTYTVKPGDTLGKIAGSITAPTVKPAAPEPVTPEPAAVAQPPKPEPTTSQPPADLEPPAAPPAPAPADVEKELEPVTVTAEPITSNVVRSGDNTPVVSGTGEPIKTGTSDEVDVLAAKQELDALKRLAANAPSSEPGETPSKLDNWNKFIQAATGKRVMDPDELNRIQVPESVNTELNDILWLAGRHKR